MQGLLALESYGNTEEQTGSGVQAARGPGQSAGSRGPCVHQHGVQVSSQGDPGSAIRSPGPKP